jgi:predicted transposase YbfD/YdcC
MRHGAKVEPVAVPLRPFPSTGGTTTHRSGARTTGGAENLLRWILDISFGEDGSTVRKDNASQNLSLLMLKKIALI